MLTLWFFINQIESKRNKYRIRRVHCSVNSLFDVTDLNLNFVIRRNREAKKKETGKEKTWTKGMNRGDRVETGPQRILVFKSFMLFNCINIRHGTRIMGQGTWKSNKYLTVKSHKIKILFSIHEHCVPIWQEKKRCWITFSLWATPDSHLKKVNWIIIINQSVWIKRKTKMSKCH